MEPWEFGYVNGVGGEKGGWEGSEEALLVVVVEKEVEAFEPVMEVRRPCSGVGRERVVDVEVKRVCGARGQGKYCGEIGENGDNAFKFWNLSGSTRGVFGSSHRSLVFRDKLVPVGGGCCGAAERNDTCSLDCKVKFDRCWFAKAIMG